MDSPVLLFQRLAFEWGREGRSALLTARRRELPKSYPLSLADVPAGVAALAQNVEWTDADGFLHAHETRHEYADLSGLHPDEVTVNPGPAGSVELEGVELVPTARLGIPNLGPRLRLGLGQLARFEWNEHLGGGRVRHTIISVCLSPRTVSRDPFTRVPDLYSSHCIDLNQRRLKAGRAG